MINVTILVYDAIVLHVGTEVNDWIRIGIQHSMMGVLQRRMNMKQRLPLLVLASIVDHPHGLHIIVMLIAV